MKRRRTHPQLIQLRPIASSIKRAFGTHPMALPVFFSEDAGRPFELTTMHAAISRLQEAMRRE